MNKPQNTRVNTYNVFQYKIPPDDKRPQLSNSYVAVDVGWSRFRNTRSKFGITQTCVTQRQTKWIIQVESVI